MSVAHKFNHIDCDTRDTVTGYLRRIERNLKTERHDASGVSFYHIPRAITLLCISYVDDISLHHGHYKWIISGTDLVHQILLCHDVGHCIESQPFEIGKLQWKVTVFPNGDKPKRRGLFMVNLVLLHLPPKWSHVLILRTMALEEMKIKRSTIRSYKKETASGWRSKTLSLSEIKALSPKRLTLSVTIKILRIELLNAESRLFYECHPVHYEKVTSLKWVIPRSLLMEGDEGSECHKCYQSGDRDGMWCLQFCPRSQENCVYLQLLMLPQNVERMEVQYTMQFEELGLRSTLVSLFEYESSAFGWKIPKHRFQSLPHNPLQETVTFSCTVVIVNEYDANGVALCEVESEWMRFKERTKSMTSR